MACFLSGRWCLGRDLNPRPTAEKAAAPYPGGRRRPQVRVTQQTQETPESAFDAPPGGTIGGTRAPAAGAATAPPARGRALGPATHRAVMPGRAQWAGAARRDLWEDETPPRPIARADGGAVCGPRRGRDVPDVARSHERTPRGPETALRRSESDPVRTLHRRSRMTGARLSSGRDEPRLQRRTASRPQQNATATRISRTSSDGTACVIRKLMLPSSERGVRDRPCRYRWRLMPPCPSCLEEASGPSASIVSCRGGVLRPCSSGCGCCWAPCACCSAAGTRSWRRALSTASSARGCALQRGMTLWAKPPIPAMPTAIPTRALLAVRAAPLQAAREGVPWTVARGPPAKRRRPGRAGRRSEGGREACLREPGRSG